MTSHKQSVKFLSSALMLLCLMMLGGGRVFARRVTDSTTESVRIAETLHVTSEGGAIETTGDVGQYNSLAVDSSGHAHISYYDATNADLKYATNATGSWVITTLDSSGYVGLYSSLKIDASDKVHIAYLDSSNGALKYTTNATGNWVTSVVVDSPDSEKYYGAFCSLALDASGHAHIVYNFEDVGSEETYIMYAEGDGASWSTSRISDYTAISGSSSIAVDSHGAAHISFYHDSIMRGALMYATNASGSWSYTYPTNCGNSSGLYSSIALDSAENPYFSFYQSSYGSPRFATNTDGTWSCETFSTDHYDGLYTSLALDADDNAFITYYDSTADSLKFMTNVDAAKTSWSSVVLDEASDVGQYSSLALDHSGYFHVSYYDATNHDLKYLKFAVAGDALWYADRDGDGFGDAATSMSAWQQPDGYVTDASDCDDAHGTVNPNASEICGDSFDNDCNSIVNEGCIGETEWDDDGDGYSEDAGDCDDTDAKVSPVALEVCDGTDNDCDHKIDEYDDDVTDADVWYLDADGDGFGDESAALVACAQPAMSVVLIGDCNDRDSTITPLATEACDGIDNNCDGALDESVNCSLAAELPTDTFGDEVGETGSVSGSLATPVDNSLGACALVQTHQTKSHVLFWPVYLLGMILIICRRAHQRRTDRSI